MSLSSTSTRPAARAFAALASPRRRPAQGFALLVRCQFRRSAHVDAAPLARSWAPPVGASDEFALEFCQPTQESEHQEPVRSRRVGPCVKQRRESGSGRGAARFRGTARRSPGAQLSHLRVDALAVGRVPSIAVSHG